LAIAGASAAAPSLDDILCDDDDREFSMLRIPDDRIRMQFFAIKSTISGGSSARAQLKASSCTRDVVRAAARK
jgi:hypothetical protein